MFRTDQASDAFAEYLAKEKVALDALTPLEAYEWFFRFYAHRRAEGVDLTRDGDQLLFQWGTYDWGEGHRFEIDLCRQLVAEEAGMRRAKLSLRYLFAPTAQLDAFGAGQRWCPGPDEVSPFAELVRKHPVIALVGMRRDGERSLVLEVG